MKIASVRVDIAKSIFNVHDVDSLEQA